MSLSEADLDFLRISESKGPGEIHKFPSSVGRLHAMLTRADPDEERRIRNLLAQDPLPDPDRDDDNDRDDGGYERGAALAREFKTERWSILR